MKDRISRLRATLSDRARITAMPGAATLSVLLVGLMVGSGAFLLNPLGASESAVTDSDTEVAAPTDEQLNSARSSLNSARMMFSLMSSSVTSATSSVEQITGSTASIFDAVDTGASASGELVTALENAPNLSAAATQINDGTLAMSSALNQASTIAEAAARMDSLVTPVIEFLEAAPAGDNAEALDLLRSLQESSRDVDTNLGAINGLRDELDRVSDSAQGVATTVDGAVGQALTSTRQLQDGFSGLAAARGDVEASAADINEGLGQLGNVFDSISEDLDDAQTNLTPTDFGGGETAPPAGVDGSRVGWAILFGSGAAVAMLGAVLLARRTPTDEQPGRTPGSGSSSAGPDPDGPDPQHPEPDPVDDDRLVGAPG